MNWSEWTWEKEDVLYRPKRKINNKSSHYIHHNSGYLYSNKMKREVGYESFWGEYLFYLYLELDKSVIRYYEQPIEIPISYIEDNYEIKVWQHIPDVLVFRQGYRPFLFQIKGSNTEVRQNKLIETECKKYAGDKNWNYKTIYPKEISEEIKSNIFLLSNFIRPRNYYNLFEEELKKRVFYLEETTIIEIAKSFSSKIDYRMIIPLVYHLITSGSLKVDINKKISEESFVSIGNVSSFFEKMFIKGI